MIGILLLSLWVIICLCEGKRDGVLYHNRMFNSISPDNKNIHWVFSIERLVILSLIFWVYCIFNSALSAGVFILSLVFMFSWIHNGMYYFTRNKLDKNVYIKGWFDSSTSSEARIELNLVSRTFMFITGVIGIAASYTIK